MNRPDKIILHHSATDSGTFESIKRYHVEKRGFKDIGYHYLIEIDGTLHKGRAENTTGAHTLGENDSSIGICLVGNFDKYKPNQEQLDTLYNLIKDIFNRYGKLPIYPHNKFANKTCPGTQFPLMDVVSQAYKEEHWSEKHWKSLKNKGIKIHDKRYDEPITRGEVFALLDQIIKG